MLPEIKVTLVGFMYYPRVRTIRGKFFRVFIMWQFQNITKVRQLAPRLW